MAMKHLTASEAVAQRDRMEVDVALATDHAVKRFLAKVVAASRSALRKPGPQLVASAIPAEPAPSDLTIPQANQWLTLGRASGWWSDTLDEVVEAVAGIWTAVYSEAGVEFPTNAGSSLDPAAPYLAKVRDRLVQGIRPPLPEAAFDMVRQETAWAISRGLSKGQLSTNIAKALSWDPERTHWQEQYDAASGAIDALLDPLGKPGSPVREAFKAHSPEVAALQQRMTAARLAMDRNESVWKTRATAIARTETTGAYAYAAINALAAEGVEKKVWVATEDGRTRPSHAAADGQSVLLGQPFRVGDAALQMPCDPSAPAGEVVNCVTGDTLIQWAGYRMPTVTRREFSGSLVELVLSTGDHLTCTPNHPVLSPFGYVPAQVIREGQYLLAAGQPPAPEVDHVPASIEELYRSAVETGQTRRVRGSAVDFHGDGTEAEVEIIRPDLSLPNEGEPPLPGQICKEALVRLSDREGTGSSSSAGNAPMFEGLGIDGWPTSGTVSRFGESLPLLEGHAGEAEPIRLGSGAYREPEFIEATHDGRTRYPEGLAHLEDAASLGVQLAKVVQVNVLTGDYVVYNLSTEGGWYIGNSIWQHNCRCTIIGDWDNEDERLAIEQGA